MAERSKTARKRNKNAQNDKFLDKDDKIAQIEREGIEQIINPDNNMAKKKTWADKIRKACKDAGTYRPFFGLAINQLAEIMEIRDKAKEQFEESGGNPVVMHTNKAGHKNIVKNPALVVINECNQQALAYWRDLGLTPAGFKRLDGTAVEKKEASFEEVLKGIGL